MMDSEYVIALRIRHPHRSPHEISTALRIDPDRCWNKGATRTTPSGKMLAGRQDENFWSAELAQDLAIQLSLPRAIARLLGRLEDHRAFFEMITNEGGRTELSVLWRYAIADDAIALDHALLARLAALGLDLTIDLARQD